MSDAAVEEKANNEEEQLNLEGMEAGETSGGESQQASTQEAEEF